METTENNEFTFILMKKNDAGVLETELGSYTVSQGGEYMLSAYAKADKAYFLLSTGVDTADWQYSAIYDNFDHEPLVKAGFAVEDDEEQYNPAWLVSFGFIENETAMTERLEMMMSLFISELTDTLDTIEGLENEYED